MKIYFSVLITFLLFKSFHLVSLNSLNSHDDEISFGENVVHWDFGSYIRPENKSVKFGLVIFSPKRPGTYPVIIFNSGFDGLAPSFIYEDFLKQLTFQTNQIVIILDRFGFIKLPNKEENMLEITLNWTLANIKRLFNDKKTPLSIRGRVTPDITTYGITLMSHSSSGHTVTSYLNKTCGLVKSFILLDPVDGYDPFGFLKLFITNPPNQLPFLVPTLIISTGLDAVSTKEGIPACAPTNTSNRRFYDSLSGPTIFLNFTTYGHADLLEDWARETMSRFLCKVCESECDFPVYKKNLVNAVNYFLLAVQQKNQTYLNVLENPKDSTYFDSKIMINSTHKYNGFNILQTGPFCVHS